MIITFPCPSAPYPIGGVVAQYEFANGLARRGHEVHLVHAEFMNCRIESLDDLAWFRFEPGIVHHLIPGGELYAPDGPGPHSDIMFGTGAGPEFGLPVLLVQGFEMLTPDLEREAFRTPCLKVCIASWLVDVGVHFGMPRDQFEVVPMGIDHHRFRCTRPLRDRAVQVAMLHHTHPAKGWDTGLATLDLVHEQVPELRAVVFGTSEPREQLPDWITFIREPDADALVDRIYNTSRIFLQPSNYEGFGFTAVEAMACGCALVTTDNGGSRDYAHHSRTALVAPPRDAEALARDIVTLLHDDARRMAIAQAGCRHVQQFDWDRGAALLEQHLERYLAEPARYRREPGPVPVAQFDLWGTAAGALVAHQATVP